MLSAVWLIPALPLLGFLVLLAWGRKLGEPAAGWLATLMVAGSFVAGLVTFVGLLGQDEHHRQFTFTLFEWLPVGGLSVDMGFLVDPLSITMVLFVTGVGSLIHLYSIGYMHGDPRFHTFFVYLNLFAFSMLMLVLGDNLLVTFLGWEGVGACSYFLVSFWFQRETAAVAGKKAFVTNRVGDWGFMVAMFLTFASLGTLTYAGEEGVLENVGSLGGTTALAIALLLFVGAAGKSAQLPLYVWLPDAMEGPTPVSALIHAATMVTSGVYLMARMNPLLDVAGPALTVIAVVGAATAFFAATCAVAQRDIKKVLAYSTVSQLGYMFLAIGSGAYVAAIFHMITHAFFKALLFLGAGSVIHGMHDEQDMRRMGALRKLMPVTAATFIVGWLAIAGIPPFSGFWSKDEILAAAWDLSPVLWLVGVVTALLTAYYMSRQVFLVFYGQPRWSGTAGEADAQSVPADERGAPEGGPGASAPGGVPPVSGPVKVPHESPGLMTFPLVVLAGLAAVAGLLNLPGVFTLEHFLEPVFEDRLHKLSITAGMQITLATVAGGGRRRRHPRGPGPLPAPHPARRALRARVPAAGVALRRGAGGVLRRAGPGLRLVHLRILDGRVIDGAVNGVATLVRGGGSRLRLTQTGYLRNYALGMAAGAVLLLGFFALRTGLV